MKLVKTSVIAIAVMLVSVFNRIPEYALVRDIQIHPATNDLILGTHGRGVIIIDDITPMRILTKDIVDKDVYLIPNKPIELTGGKFGDSGSPQYRWMGGA